MTHFGRAEQPRGVVTPPSDHRDVESIMTQKQLKVGQEGVFANLPFPQKTTESQSSGQGILDPESQSSGQGFLDPTLCFANSLGETNLGQTQSLMANSSSLAKMTQTWPWGKKHAFDLSTDYQTSTLYQKVSHPEKVPPLHVQADNRLRLEALLEELPAEPISTIFWPVNTSMDDDEISDVSALCSDVDANYWDKEIHITDMLAPSIDTNDDDDEVSVISISCIY